MRYRAAVHCIIILLLIPSAAFSYSTGFTIGTWGNAPQSGVMEQGSYVQAGLVTGLTQRLELELVSVVQAAPVPGSALFGGGGLIWSFAGPREFMDGRTPPYYNAALSFGVLAGADEMYQNPGPVDVVVYLRVTPLVLKGPFYGKRERAATFGLSYSIQNQEVSAFWNILMVDFYRKAH